MASVFGRSILGFTVAKIAHKSNLKSLLLLAIISSVLHDLDVFSFQLGIPYESLIGHRGFTHSILFAIIWAVVLTFIFSKTRKKLFFW